MPRVPAADRQRIVDTYNAGEDFIEAARILGVKRTTAYSIIYRYQRDGAAAAEQPSGGRPSKLDNESRDLLLMIVEDIPAITLRNLNRRFREIWPHKPVVSDSTIARCLDGLLISLKSCNDVPAARNSPATKEARINYAHWMYTTGLQCHRIYIDETGFNLFTRRHYGRAPIGQRVHRMVGNQRGRNITVIAAISDHVGLVYHEIIHGSVNRAVFIDFVTSLSVILGDERAVLLMDNAPCHSNVTVDNDALAIKYLPPNSPFLNPIENCFSVFKADMKQRLNMIQEEVMNRHAAAAANMTMAAWRETIMDRELEQSIYVITQGIVENNYRHADGYLQKCVQNVDILH